MINIIFGAPGSGKSTLNTFMLISEYWEQGLTMQAAAIERISELNLNRSTPLSLPDRPPIYCDYKMRLQVGYEDYFTPYFIDGFHLGLDNDALDVMHVAPGAKIHLSEVQRYYDSRKSSTFPEWVSRFFEMHRHYGVDVTMDIQRSNLVDVNIRDLCRHYIEVVEMKHVKDDLDRIERTKFTCREFGSYNDVEDYMTSHKRNYDVVRYEYEGDIFDCFDSCAYFDKFVPANDKDFSFMEFGNNSIIEPVEFRHKVKANKGANNEREAGRAEET